MGKTQFGRSIIFVYASYFVSLLMQLSGISNVIALLSRKGKSRWANDDFFC
jgi:hypothetical protein